VWLEKGRVAADGPAAETIALYRERVAEEEGEKRTEPRAGGAGPSPTTPSGEKRIGSGLAVVEEVELLDGAGHRAGRISSREPAALRMRVKAAGTLSDFVFGFAISTVAGDVVFGSNTDIDGFAPGEFAGNGVITLEIPACALAPGLYSVDAAAHARDGAPYDYRRDILRFEVTADTATAGVWNPERRWRFEGPIRWKP
jgi:hypothetical protein